MPKKPLVDPKMKPIPRRGPVEESLRKTVTKKAAAEAVLPRQMKKALNLQEGHLVYRDPYAKEKLEKLVEDILDTKHRIKHHKDVLKHY
jgi:hypothetical protein